MPAKILVCLDSDAQPSVFDGVVAVDAGVDHLFRHSGMQPEQVRDLVYGAIFTRGPKELNHTAVFVGGSDVAIGEKLLAEVTGSFFGPMRVSVMLDSNGANTTAAAAVLAARKHVELRGATATVLAATGPVGRRIVRLLAREGARVRVGSRKLAQAEQACQEIGAAVPGAELTPVETRDDASVKAAVDGAQVLITAGAPKVELVSTNVLSATKSLAVAVDLNAVPPLGIGGIEVHDNATERNGLLAYGAIGVGGTKMKIHKAALKQLFERNDLVLDAEAIYEIGKSL
ncbi:MAG: NAD(P)-dependent methylenetetrahydromethanopterin dehydrogenase [Pirellulales bacterium]